MKTALIVTVVAIALFAGVGGVLYAFGTPQAPDLATTGGPGPAPVAAPAQEPVEESAEQPEPGSGGMGDVPKPAPGTKAPPADPNSPLHIQIPGCVCHSDDPAIVETHSEYRMNQCAGCHAGGTPTGQE